MADRFWVGGTGTWDGTAGTKWATTSGGAGGASVPTSADDVFFDANSGTVTVTIGSGNGGAKSINCTGFTGLIAGTSSISVAGSITLVAGMSYTLSGTVTLTATGTLVTAGKTFGSLTVNAPGHTITLGSALNASGRTIYIAQGTFNTANYSVTCNSFMTNNSNPRTINFGSSTVTVTSDLNLTPATNLTFNAGTSQINLQYGTGTFYSDSQTFYNVSNTSTSSGQRSFLGSNTFNTLTFTTGTAGLNEFVFQAGTTQTLNALSASGVGANSRCFIRSDTEGTSATLSIATLSFPINNNDFRDITITGAVAPISPLYAGNCGGNSGIIFPASKTVYRVGSGGSWSDSSGWALTSGGAGGANNYPLVQDTAVIDNGAASGITLTLTDQRNIGTLDCSARTNAITINHNATSNFYGSYKLGPGVTVSGTSAQTFRGRGTMDFISVGKTISFQIDIDTLGGTFRLGDAFSSSNYLFLIKGGLNANDYNLSCAAFASANSNIRTITMGSGLWTFSATGTTWNTTTTTNLTFNKNTANILLSDTSTTNRLFAGGGLSFNKLTIGGTTGTSTTSLLNSNNFTELASTKTVAHTVALNTNQGTINTWSITGSPGNVVTVNSNGVGTRRTFTLTNVTADIDYLSVKDIGELSGNKFYVGANSTDGGNNSNVYFTAAPVAGGSMMMLF